MPLNKNLDGYRALVHEAVSALKQTIYKITGVKAKSTTSVVDDSRRKYITLTINVVVKLPRPLPEKALTDSESE